MADEKKMAFGAAIFDLDGVLTKTALVHAEAWKEMRSFLDPTEEEKGDGALFVDKGGQRWNVCDIHMPAQGYAAAVVIEA